MSILAAAAPSSAGALICTIQSTSFASALRAICTRAAACPSAARREAVVAPMGRRTGRKLVPAEEVQGESPDNRRPLHLPAVAPMAALLVDDFGGPGTSPRLGLDSAKRLACEPE